MSNGAHWISKFAEDDEISQEHEEGKDYVTKEGPWGEKPEYTDIGSNRISLVVSCQGFSRKLEWLDRAGSSLSLQVGSIFLK